VCAETRVTPSPTHPADLSPQEEATLVARIKTGDQVAFAKLVAVFGPRMFTIARRFMRCDDDCNDAVQDAFISVFKAIDGFEANSRLAAWLHRITVNCCLMKLRVASFREETSIDEMLSNRSGRRQRSRWSSEIFNPTDKVQTDEIRAVVRQAITELPEAYRMVVRLRYVEEMNTAATAALLKTTENNVKYRLRRARRALSRRLQAVMIGEYGWPVSHMNRRSKQYLRPIHACPV
jgi:RNA polymerase sigma-70 factor, ECF subfamily